MEATVTLDRVGNGGRFTGDFLNQSLNIAYKIQLTGGSYYGGTYDSHAALSAGQAAIADVPNGLFRVPSFREQWLDLQLYAQEFSLSQTTERPWDEWICNVGFLSPPTGQLGNFSLHPLLRPAQIKIDFIDGEEPIILAQNLDAFTGSGFGRPAGTWGPITNSALQETIDIQTKKVWNGVITITRWVSTIEAALLLNYQYRDTTNSTTILNTFPPRTLQYQVSRCRDKEEQDNIPFYEMETSIEIKKTTDIYLNNVGYKQVKASKLVNMLDEEGETIAEPKFLDLAGKESKNPITVGYRYLNPVSYIPLVS